MMLLLASVSAENSATTETQNKDVQSHFSWKTPVFSTKDIAVGLLVLQPLGIDIYQVFS